MNCQRCQLHVHMNAPFCPVCGADPVVGADWLATSYLLVDAAGQPVLPNGGRVEGAAFHELVTMLVHQATLIAAAEGASAEAVARWQRGGESDPTTCGLRAREAAEQRRNEVFEAESGAAVARIAECLPQLHAVAESLRESVSEGEPPAEVFESQYAEATWVFSEYCAYLGEPSEDELRDILRRRTMTLLSRRGLADFTTFAAPDGSFELTYDCVALVPLPDEATDARDWVRESFGGYEGSFGELALVLVPAAWRGWEDAAMAPWASLIVFVQADPLAGIACEDRDWEGDRAGACAHYGAWLSGSDETVAAVKPATISGLPAVRHQAFNLIGDQTHVLVDIAWVRGPQHTYNIVAWAPDQRHELMRAVHAAFAGFAPAGCAAARDAAPAERAPTQDAPDLFLVPPEDARRSAAGGEEER